MQSLLLDEHLAELMGLHRLEQLSLRGCSRIRWVACCACFARFAFARALLVLAAGSTVRFACWLLVLALCAGCVAHPMDESFCTA